MKNTRLKMQIMKCRLTNCPNEIKKFIKNLFEEKKIKMKVHSHALTDKVQQTDEEHFENQSKIFEV